MPDPLTPTRGARLLKTGIGVLLLLSGLGFTAGLVWAWERAMVTRHWQEVPCTVVSSRITEGQFSDYSPVSWRTDVSYLYQAGGEMRTGSRIRRVEGPTPHRERAEEKAARYPAGRATVCYVDPADPASAVLEHDTKAPLYTLWWPMLFAVGGGGMIWSAWRKPRGATPLVRAGTPDTIR